MTGFVVDGSFGLVEQRVTGKQLLAIGASGVIGYVSPDPSKNLTPSMLDDYLTSGLTVGLVWENTDHDMLSPGAGSLYGDSAYKQGRTLGYDTDNCVIYAAADWNVQVSELPLVNGFMSRFGSYVPHPGIYSNQRTLDMLAVTGHAEYFWQSNSKSYSNGTSTHANLQQLYADPRALKLPVDINNIVRTPLGMMGENMKLDADDQAFILKAVGAGARTAATLVSQDEDGTKTRVVQLLQQAQADAGVLAQLQQWAATAQASGTPIDYDKLAHALAAHLLVQVSAQ